MGCGASAAKSAVTPEQLQELAHRFQKQTEQILELEKAQLQIYTQVSVLQRAVHNSHGWLRVRSDECAENTKGPELALTDKEPEVKVDKSSLGVLRLIPVMKTHAWGQPYSSSLVARLCESPERVLNKGLNYAEMWMGTHPTGPANVRLEGLDGVGHSLQGLKDTIARRPQFWLGSDVQRGDLPFMLKVLSANKATSIQAHPGKELAQQLHREQPEAYKDSNQKPALCLPLGEFEALVAFRPLEEIRKHVTQIRELGRLIGDKPQQGVKALYSSLLRSEPSAVTQQLTVLVHRLGLKKPEDLSPEEKLVLRLQQHFPGDVGIFSVFFLNYVNIPADAHRRFIFIPASEPYCYLKGNCVECMSLSDNTVRAGLTNKLKDVETFLRMLSYRDDLLGSLIGAGEPLGERVAKYTPPVLDFMVYQVEGGNNGTTQSDPQVKLPHASILICVEGNFSVSFNAASQAVEEIRQGQCFFCRADSCLTVLRSEEGSQLFIATY